MIKTVADLLDAFLKKESGALAKRTDIKHGPTIGAMYEGLTRDALEKHILLTEPLSVVSGFARGRSGTLSRQLDCMLVIGEGEDVPYQPTKIFPIEQVIAVIEVKKSLGVSALDEGYDNLLSVVELEPASPPRMQQSTFRTAFQSITGTSLPDDPKQMPPELYAIYRYVLRECLAPARILLGYEGYKTARGIREGVINHAETLVGRAGHHGPETLPNLIINSNHAVVKLNGMPWGVPPDKDGWVPVMASSGGTPTANILLEIIWSRLNYLGLIPAEAFGEDLEMEQWVRLLDARYVKERGWEFQSMPPDVEAEPDAAAKQWEPVELSKDEYVLVTIMGQQGEFDLTVPPLNAPSQAELLKLLDGLMVKGLVGKDPVRPNIYRLLTRELQTLFLPDGRVVVGENNAGRLARWLERRLREAKAGK